jgi:hypothetical protein
VVRTHNSCNPGFPTEDVVVRTSGSGGQGRDDRLGLSLPMWLVSQLCFVDTFLC